MRTLSSVSAGKCRQAAIGKAHGLERAEIDGILGRPRSRIFSSVSHDLLDLAEEPGIVVAGGMNILDAGAEPEGLGDFEDAVGGGRAERGADGVLVVAFAGALNRDLIETGEAGLEAAQRLLQRFLEGAADRHDFAHRFHRGGEGRIGAGEFLEGKARDLGDDIIDGRLEGRRAWRRR